MNQKERGINISLLSKQRGVLMAIGIILVMYCHSTLCVGKEFAIFYSVTKQFAQIGVDFFIFLSGMGIFHSLNKDSRVMPFYQRRLHKIMLPYILLVVTFGIIRIVINHSGGIKGFIYSYSLITFYLRGELCEWYIAAIIVLYLISPLLYKTINKNPKNVAVLILFTWVLSAVYFVFAHIFEGTKYHNAFAFVNEIFIVRIPLYMIGMCFGKVISENENFKANKIGTALILVLGMGAFILNTVIFPGKKLWFSQWYISRFIFTIICIPCLLYISLWFERGHFSNKMLLYLGTITLELYLVHEKVLMILDKYYSYNLLSSIIVNVFAVILSLIIATVVSQLVKKLPVMSKRKKM